jgi:hypothetical protein
LEDYPFRVEELTARGELGRVLVYADHPIIASAAFSPPSSNTPSHAFDCATGRW